MRASYNKSISERAEDEEERDSTNGPLASRSNFGDFELSNSLPYVVKYSVCRYFVLVQIYI